MKKIFVTSDLWMTHQTEPAFKILQFVVRSFKDEASLKTAMNQNFRRSFTFNPLKSWDGCANEIKRRDDSYHLVVAHRNAHHPGYSNPTIVSAKLANEYPDRTIALVELNTRLGDRRREDYKFLDDYTRVGRYRGAPVFALDDDQLAFATLSGLLVTSVIGCPPITQEEMGSLCDWGPVKIHNHMWSGNAQSPT